MLLVLGGGAQALLGQATEVRTTLAALAFVASLVVPLLALRGRSGLALGVGALGLGGLFLLAVSYL